MRQRISPPIGIGYDTTAGEAIVALCSVFAQTERGADPERVISGRARARTEGTKLGGPRVLAEVDARVESIDGWVKKD